MMQAYIDESGTHDQASVIVMAGFVARNRRWLIFDRKWQRVLNPDGADRVFHATDCLGRFGRGEFEGVSKGERDALGDRLGKIAGKYPRASFACAFSLRDYEAVMPDSFKKKWKHPYFLCMFHIANLLALRRGELSLSAQEKVAFVFAHKPKFTGLLTELYQDLRATAPSLASILGRMTPYGDPKEDSPIQAADLLCYVVRTFYERDYFVPGSAHKRTISLGRRLGLRHHLAPDFLDRKALMELARIYEETRQEAGEWKWNTPRR
jgi:Protein of unknown function (DUF3800)